MGEIGQVPNHQVKVDNWPLFFLQRLHHFYRKKSHCDLTLLFSTLDTVKSVKVHKLVLHACTDYFESLDIMKDSEHGEVLQLSNEMHPDVVIPIISFMYTGKLEFPVTLQPRLYEAATKLRMTILTKLLDVQPGKTWEKPSQQVVDEGVKVSILQTTVSKPAENNQLQDHHDISATDDSLQKNFSTSSSAKQVEEPIITLTPVSPATTIPLKKTQNKPEVTVIKRADSSSVKSSSQAKAKFSKKNINVQMSAAISKPIAVDPNLPPTLPGRKLPVWKRKVPFTGSKASETFQTIKRQSSFRSMDLPKPTRFEWDDDLNDLNALGPVEDAPKILSHDGPSKIRHPITFEDEATQKMDSLDDSLKRSSDGSASDSPPYKRSRSDLQDMKEYGKQQKLRNEIICSEENEENDADDVVDTDDLYGTCDDEQDDVSNFNQSSMHSSTPKPILKTVSKPEPPMSPKRVRFSLEGKENNQQQIETSSDFTMVKPEAAVAKQKIVLPMDVSQIQSGKHHVKIVSEVLKKYPNLAKRENIKLRVVSKNAAAVPPKVQKAVEGETGTGSKSGSPLVSYIFLTNKSTGERISPKNDSNNSKGFDVENKTGPWFCHVCNEGDHLEFDSYFTYRRHLVEVHELKIDARICEYCGLRNSKRNHLFYHLYTKHGINPPAHVSFPKCPECDYIALSEGLLLKHRSTHDPKGLMCFTCNVVFKTYSAMQLHMNSDWHRNTLNDVSVLLSDYPCPFCEERFENGNNLKDHMESYHHSQRIPTKEEVKQIYRCPYCESLFGTADFLGRHIVSVHWGKDDKTVFKEQEMKTKVCQPQSGQQLQSNIEGEGSEKVENNENQTTTEMEPLSSVASDVTTSLNLGGNEETVIYIGHKAEEQEVGREATIVSEGECKEYIITGTLENINSKQSQEVNEVIETIDVENDDSNSRTSNVEEVCSTSCSDHDYSEPQIDDNYRQVIPVESVDNQITEGSVIQQIVPDQRIVFANEGNVVFPQRVLLTSGKVVIPTVPGEQKVILSQVLPQTRIILSGSILQQPGSIIDESNSAIVFANPEGTQMENIQTVHYQIETPENTENTENTKNTENAEHEKGNSDTSQRNSQQAEVNEEAENKDKETKVSVDTQELSQIESLDPTKEEGDSNSNVQIVSEEYRTANRRETSKIVDDWDEMNESSNNVENRSDGPSRPEFF